MKLQNVDILILTFNIKFDAAISLINIYDRNLQTAQFLIINIIHLRSKMLQLQSFHNNCLLPCLCLDHLINTMGTIIFLKVLIQGMLAYRKGTYISYSFRYIVHIRQDFSPTQLLIYIKYRIRDPQSSPLKKPLRRLTEEINKDIDYKNEKHQSAFVDVDSFGAQQFNLHKKVSSSQRGKEYLSKLMNLLPSVFDEFKHDELERYSNISYNPMKNSYNC